LEQNSTFHILSNTVPPCPSQTGEGEGRVVVVEDWKESNYFHTGVIGAEIYSQMPINQY